MVFHHLAYEVGYRPNALKEEENVFCRSCRLMESVLEAGEVKPEDWLDAGGGGLSNAEEIYASPFRGVHRYDAAVVHGDDHDDVFSWKCFHV